MNSDTAVDLFYGHSVICYNMLTNSAHFAVKDFVIIIIFVSMEGTYISMSNLTSYVWKMYQFGQFDKSASEK